MAKNTQYEPGLHQGQDFSMMNNNYLPAIPNFRAAAPMYRPGLPPSAIPNPSNVFNVQPQAASATSPNTPAVGHGDFFTHNNLSANASAEPDLIRGCPRNTPGFDIASPPSGLCEHHGALSAQSVDGRSIVTTSSQDWDASASPYTSVSDASVTNLSSGSFTFTIPTQSHLYSSSLSASSSNNRLNYSRATAHTFAPTGCSAQWQHAVPQRLPWLHHGRLVNQQGINVFTGSNNATVCSLSGQVTSPSYMLQLGDPVPSCSTVFKRPKRRHAQEQEDLSPSNKIHLTEDKIEKHMQELRIHNQSPPAHPTQDDTLISDASHDNLVNSYHQIGQQISDTPWASSNSSQFFRQTQQQQWQIFQQLENTLEMEEEASDTEDGSVATKTTHKVHLLDGIGHSVTPQPVLPKAIMDNILNPCRQIMLWSPPGSVMKSVTSPELSSTGGTDGGGELPNMMEAVDAVSDSNSQVCDSMDCAEVVDMDDALDL